MEFLRACFFMIWTSTCATFVDVDTSCNKNNIGNTVCYLESSRFDEYQWGICVTNEYLQVYSKGKYLCEHHYPYCHLHCMLEQHNILRGPVYEECRCRPDTSISHKSSVLLPHSCYIPRHNDCRWFGNCVKLRYECADLELSNVVKYVQGECEMNNGVFQALSIETRKFIRDIHTSCEEGDECHDWKSRWNVTSPGRYCALKECKWWRKPGDWPYSFGSKNKIIEAFCIDDENECHPIDEEEESPFRRTIGDKVYNECYCKEVNKELLTTCKS
ncbi:hypothetical protein FSP39_002473 [Pinctada imbricata]|uniref:Uncharacterized protein n=1 Tax=Pinctada imbricata TaxID=66713 RepID=A0AA89BWP4_PINIB|nr:hypothetical protein FSP39_002473 [Pinctada imbricata]